MNVFRWICGLKYVILKVYKPLLLRTDTHIYEGYNEGEKPLSFIYFDFEANINLNYHFYDRQDTHKKVLIRDTCTI